VLKVARLWSYFSHLHSPPLSNPTFLPWISAPASPSYTPSIEGLFYSLDKNNKSNMPKQAVENGAAGNGGQQPGHGVARKVP
jgi:hypothetical protein